MLKTDEIEFFWKILVCPEEGQKAQNGSIFVFAHYNSTFFKIGMKLRENKYSKLTELSFLEKFLLVQKWTKKAQNGLIFCSSIMAAIFLRIGSLHLSHIWHEGIIRGTQN